MKLAEALIARSDLQVRANALLERAVGSARHQEGETPGENAVTLVAEAAAVYEELGALVAQINRTNATHVLVNDMTLTTALAQREVLLRRRMLLTKVADAAVGKEDFRFGGRQMRSELRWEIAVPVSEMRSESDRLARDHRELDAVIQQANWTVDLIV